MSESSIAILHRANVDVAIGLPGMNPLQPLVFHFLLTPGLTFMYC